MSSSRRKSQNSRVEALRQLKTARETGSRLYDYEVHEQEAIYDVVDEEVYENICRRRMQQEDFVVDDNGMGYVDYGQEEWDDPHREGNYNSSDEEKEYNESNQEKNKNRKRKLDDKYRQKDSKNSDVTPSVAGMLRTSNHQKKEKKRLKEDNFIAIDNITNDEDLLASIINDLDADAAPDSNHKEDNKGLKSVNESNSSVAKYFKKPKINPTSTVLTLVNERIIHRKQQEQSQISFSTVNEFTNEEGPPLDMSDYFGLQNTDQKTSVEEITLEESEAEGEFKSDVTIKRTFKSIDSTTADNTIEEIIQRAENETSTDKEKSAGKHIEVNLDEDDDLILPEEINSQIPTVKLESAVKTAKAHQIKNVPNTVKILPKFKKEGTNSNLNDRDSRSENKMMIADSRENFFTPQNTSLEDITNADGSIYMYWFDAQENQGVVYLFGKVFDPKANKYVSCCIAVNNIERNVFLLPRKIWMNEDGSHTNKPVEEIDIYQEFDQLRKKYGISNFASKFTKRSYAFELPNVPAQADYMKVVYSFQQPALPTNLSGLTFSRAFGTNTNALEILIRKRKLMGPCWLHISGVESSNKKFSWCALELCLQNPKNVKVITSDQETTCPKSSPPLVVMSLSLKTIMNHQKHVNEIVSASILVYSNINSDGCKDEEPCVYQHTLIRQLNDIPVPVGFYDLAKRSRIKIEIMKNEPALLNNLLALLGRIDPDVLVGHNFIGFTLDVLFHRMKFNKVDSTWSRIGRLRRTRWPRLQPGAGGMGESTFEEKQAVGGRLMCDTYLASRDLIKSKNYSLAELSSSQLKIERPEFDNQTIPNMFWDAQDLIGLIKHNELDAYLSMSLMMKLQVLPLTKQLTNLAGNLWSKTLTGARAERNEYLLLHEFHRAKFIVPDKANYGTSQQKCTSFSIGANDDEDDIDNISKRKINSASGRRKPAYSGGLVLEPKKGFYDKYVLLLDFNSLYPSIIQEFNICFTTVERHYSKNEKSEDELEKVPDLPDVSLPQGILPKLLANLVNRRRQVKNLMKDPKLSEGEKQQYDIRQKALKLTANSMYGCLGFSNSRFFAKPLAILITAKGRETLQTTVDMAIEQKLDVIYGDTDSIMIYTNSEDLNQVKKIGNDFKNLVNKRYKLLEIEMDGMFQRMLLLRKKKYAALVVNEKKDGTIETLMETKGLEEVRRDWCALSKEVSHFILNQLFSGAGREDVVQRIHNYLTIIGKTVRSGTFPVSKFVIYKGLTKAPEDYADKRTQPHVQVALAMKAKGLSIRVHDTIPYVICQGQEDLIASRAFHPDYLGKEGSNLIIDYEWYLSTQILPPVTRLIGPIDETDSVRIAECLGLDTRKFSSFIQSDALTMDDEMKTLDSQVSDEERFKNVEKWKVICPSCDYQFEFQRCFLIQDSKITSSFECPKADCHKLIPLSSLQTQLMVFIRRHIRKYGQFILVCDDSSCKTKTSQMSIYGRKCLNLGCRGQMSFEYNDKALSTQLIYCDYLMNIEKLISKHDEMKEGIKRMALNYGHYLEPLNNTVQLYLDKNARTHVDLNQVFSFLK